MKNFCFLLCLLILSCQSDEKTFNSSLSGRIGIFENQAIEDVSFQFDETTQTYRLPAADSETPRLLSKQLEGDFSLSVRLPKTNKAGTYGLLLFTNMETKKPIARLQIENDQLSFIPAVEVNRSNALSVAANYLKLERIGTQLTAYYALENETFRPIAMQSLPLDEPLYGGLFGQKTTKELVFSNLDLTYLPMEEESIVSRIEVFDLETKTRRLLLEKQEMVEAPIWHPDGHLIVNAATELYRIDLEATKTDWILMPLDSSKNITTDYGFSTDCDSIFYSQKDSLGKKMYVAPLDSLHTATAIADLQNAHFQDVINGEQKILYTSRKRERDRMQLYVLDVKNDKRIPLGKSITDADFCESNALIYCSSKRSGKQKIWQLTALGLQEKQLTFDDWQDWSPHASSDGRDLLMLSFKNDKKRTAELPFQEVYLRCLSLDKKNAAAEIWFSFFGTTNSLSNAAFSPDGKEIVFVSYSVLPKQQVAEAQSTKTL